MSGTGINVILVHIQFQFLLHAKENKTWALLGWSR